MMKSFFRLASAAILMLFASGNAHAMGIVFHSVGDFLGAVSSYSVEDFEGTPWDPAGIKSPLVVDAGLSWNSANYFITTRAVAHSTALSITDGDAVFGGTEHTDLLSVTMPSGITAVGVFVSTLGQNHGVIIRAYDFGGFELLNATLPATGATEFGFIGLASLTNIRHVEFISTSGPPMDDFALDDFHYGSWSFGQNNSSNVVSEPASLILLGGALTLFGFAARRRRGK